MAGPQTDPTMPRMRRETAGSNGKVIAAAALVGGLAVAAVFVAFILPGQVQRPSAQPEPPPAGNSAPQATAVPDGQKAADEQKTAVLRKLAKLEGEGVRIWGVEEFLGTNLAAAEDTLARANATIVARQFGAALPLLQQAGAQLDSLEGSRPGRLAQAMDQGRAALARHDAPAAERQFGVAVVLAPGDAQAARGLERARKLPDALSRLTAGDAAMAANDLPKARDAFRQAADIDPDLEAARTKLRQVEAQLAALEYQKAVSDVVARLRDGNTRAAGAALEKAQRLRPNAPELAELRAQHAAAARASAMQDLQGRAEGLERQEKWHDAVKLYQQALALDPNAVFAGRGMAKAQQHSVLHDTIDSYLASPDRLRSAEPRSHAQAILRMAGAADGGPVLADKARRLAALLAAAQTPVVVQLKSDNATDVEIYRVGIVGAFGERQLSLMPGRYTAVGRRSGFRDVRVQFDVVQGAAMQDVVVQCTEKIR